MRIIYFDDIKRGFKIDTDAVIFKGRFFLLRNPETLLEGATKEYVDALFKKLNPDVLGDMLIKESQFPAFDGDIKNEKGKNYFLLANVVKSGRYCLVETDSKGRVIKGEKQLSQKVVGLAKEIPFKTIDFSTYKSIGHPNNVGRSIKDFTFNSKEKCLSIFDPNVINKNITIEYNINEKNAVVNEAIFEATIGMYVPMAIGLSKRDDYDSLIKDGGHGDGITDPGIKDEFEYRYRAGGGRPWHLQYDISPKGKGIGNSVKVVITDATTSKMKRLGDVFVDQGFLKIFNNDGNISSQAKLNEGGDVVPSDITNASTPVLPNLNDTNSTRPLYVMADRYLYALVTEGSKCRLKIAAPEGKGWSKTWLNGPLLNITDIRAFRMLVIGERLYFLNMAGHKSYYCNIPADKTKVGSPVEMTGDIAPPKTGEQPYGVAAYLYNGYVYLLPGHQEHYENSKIAYKDKPVSTQYLRAQFTGSTLSKWEQIECGFTFPDAMRVPYAYHGKMYLVTGRYQPANKRMRKLDIEELVNNLLVLRLNGDNNVMGVEMPKDIPGKDETGTWNKNPFNQPEYKTTNPHYIREYTVSNPNYLPERWEPDPRNRPAYTDSDGVLHPEIKYPDIHYPAQGAPNILIPAVGPKEITHPAEIYPDVWISSDKGHWISNPNNEPGKWVTNPDYKPATSRPNPNYVAGYWEPDPRNKDGYWLTDPNDPSLDPDYIFVDTSKPFIGTFITRRRYSSNPNSITVVPDYEHYLSASKTEYKEVRNTYTTWWGENDRPTDVVVERRVRVPDYAGTFIVKIGKVDVYVTFKWVDGVRVYLYHKTYHGENIGKDKPLKFYTADGQWIPKQTWVPPVKYPDVWVPPVGEPNITTPEVGEKEIWIPEKKYPDIWVPEKTGKWEPDPRNKAAYCEPNPHYKPGYWRPGEGVPEYIEKPNPNHVPGYWKADPRNKPGYWAPNPNYKPGYWTGGANLNNEGIDKKNRIVDIGKLISVYCGVFDRRPIPSALNSSYEYGEAVIGSELWKSVYYHSVPQNGSWVPSQYGIRAKDKKISSINPGDMGFRATPSLASKLSGIPSGTSQYEGSAEGWMFRLTQVGGQVLVFGGRVDCKIYRYKSSPSLGTSIEPWGDWGAVKSGWNSWKAYDPNDKGTWVPPSGAEQIWVPEVKYPDVWVPPVGEPTIQVKNPNYKEGYWIPNPNYKPGHYKDDPNDPLSDMTRPYFDMDKATVWEGSILTSGLGSGGRPGGTVSNEQSPTAPSITYRPGKTDSKQYEASYAKGSEKANAASPPTSVHLGGYSSRFTNPLGMFSMTVDGKVYYFYATGTRNAVTVEACYTGNSTTSPLWSALVAGNQEIIERNHTTIYNTTPYRALAGYGPRKPKQVWVDPIGDERIWVAGNGSEDVWVPAIGEKEICYPEVKYPDIWVPNAPPRRSDSEPDVNISVAAAKDGLFISSGYKLWRVPLEGGENNYDEYLSSDYTPVNK